MEFQYDLLLVQLDLLLLEALSPILKRNLSLKEIYSPQSIRLNIKSQHELRLLGPLQTIVMERGTQSLQILAVSFYLFSFPFCHRFVSMDL